MAEPKKYLRNKEDGFIYDWNPILAVHPKCEEVTEEQAFPERFTPPNARGRKSKLDLTTDEKLIPNRPEFTIPGLDVDASRNLP